MSPEDTLSSIHSSEAEDDIHMSDAPLSPPMGSEGDASVDLTESDADNADDNDDTTGTHDFDRRTRNGRPFPVPIRAVGHIDGYPVEGTVVPPGLSCYEVCQQYPNSLYGDGLDPFMQHNWSCGQIFNCLKKDARQALTRNHKTADKNLSNAIAKRMNKRRLKLRRDGTWDMLMLGPKIREQGCNMRGNGRFPGPAPPAPPAPTLPPQPTPPQSAPFQPGALGTPNPLVQQQPPSTSLTLQPAVGAPAYDDETHPQDEFFSNKIRCPPRPDPHAGGFHELPPYNEAMEIRRLSLFPGEDGYLPLLPANEEINRAMHAWGVTMQQVRRANLNQPAAHGYQQQIYPAQNGYHQPQVPRMHSWMPLQTHQNLAHVQQSPDRAHSYQSVTSLENGENHTSTNWSHQDIDEFTTPNHLHYTYPDPSWSTRSNYEWIQDGLDNAQNLQQPQQSVYEPGQNAFEVTPWDASVNPFANNGNFSSGRQFLPIPQSEFMYDLDRNNDIKYQSEQGVGQQLEARYQEHKEQP